MIFQKYRDAQPRPIIDVNYPSYANLEEYVTDATLKELRKVASDEELARA